MDCHRILRQFVASTDSAWLAEKPEFWWITLVAVGFLNCGCNQCTQSTSSHTTGINSLAIQHAWLKFSIAMRPLRCWLVVSKLFCHHKLRWQARWVSFTLFCCWIETANQMTFDIFHAPIDLKHDQPPDSSVLKQIDMMAIRSDMWNAFLGTKGLERTLDLVVMAGRRLFLGLETYQTLISHDFSLGSIGLQPGFFLIRVRFFVFCGPDSLRYL